MAFHEAGPKAEGFVGPAVQFHVGGFGCHRQSLNFFFAGPAEPTRIVLSFLKKRTVVLVWNKFDSVDFP
jgi:hypothetical protein